MMCANCNMLWCSFGFYWRVRLIGICFCVVMLSSFAGIQITVKKCAYIGQPVKFLYNINSDYEDISLYRENGTYIASWKWKNSSTEQDTSSDYSGKIVMDKMRNIWIFSVERKDNGSYYLILSNHGERREILLHVIVMEKKHHDVCLNSLPNSTEKYFEGVMEKQTEQQCWETFIDDHLQNMKRRNLTGEKIEEEIRKWLADHPEYIKGFLGNLTVKQIGQEIRELMDVYREHIERKQMKEHHGSTESLMIALIVIVALVVVLIAVVIIVWIKKKLCSEPNQSPTLHEHTPVPTLGPVIEEQNSNGQSTKSTAINMESFDSKSSHEHDRLLHVDQNSPINEQPQL